jgi:hypothetical protein
LWFVLVEREDIAPSLGWRGASGILQHWVKIVYPKDVNGMLPDDERPKELERNPDPLLHLGY